MTQDEKIAALQARYDFLCDAWIRGMADGKEVDAAHAALQAAKQESHA